jgi:hypothetical protein
MGILFERARAERYWKLHKLELVKSGKFGCEGCYFYRGVDEPCPAQPRLKESPRHRGCIETGFKIWVEKT